VIIALVRMRLPARASVPQGSLRQSLADGFRHVGRTPPLAALIALAAAGSFLAFPLITYLPVIADETLRAGAAGYSLLLSSFGSGAIVGAIAAAQRGNRPGRGRLALQGFVAFSVATSLALLSRSSFLSMALLAVSGVSLVTASSTLNSLVQELAPGELRGRVVAIYGLAFRGGMPVGSVVAGLLVAPLGAPLAIGGFCLALGAVAAVLLLRGGRVASL
jgi:predicted MFS family arabinose efflux permease